MPDKLTRLLELDLSKNYGIGDDGVSCVGASIVPPGDSIASRNGFDGSRLSISRGKSIRLFHPTEISESEWQHHNGLVGSGRNSCPCVSPQADKPWAKPNHFSSRSLYFLKTASVSKS